MNLNFEAANLSAYGTGPTNVPATSGIPGWTAYVSGSQVAQILYNSVNIDEPAVTIQGTNSTYLTPIQGNYSMYLQGGSTFAYGTNSAIGQTGQIPLSALSLIFWGSAANMQITFGGQLLPFSAIGNTVNYTIYGADITAYAGQTGQLLFTVSRPGGGIIDNIQFSSSPVPEPSVLGLSALGGLFLAWRRWKARKQGA